MLAIKKLTAYEEHLIVFGNTIIFDKVSTAPRIRQKKQVLQWKSEWPRKTTAKLERRRPDNHGHRTASCLQRIKQKQLRYPTLSNLEYAGGKDTNRARQCQ